MILYVNGDSHSTGAEAVNNFCFAGDDSKYWQWDMKWEPHPDNLAVSYGRRLADAFGAQLYCHARSAGSNDRVIRTTKEYLKNNKPWGIIIGWTTWEREEWYNEEEDFWYQVNGSGIDSVPEKWQNRYREYVANINWDNKIVDAHQKIWEFKQYLDTTKIPYLFFNCHMSFESIPTIKRSPAYGDYYSEYDWGDFYIGPYKDSESYTNYLIAKGFKPNKWHHFGPDAHECWASYVHWHFKRMLTAFE